MARTEDDRKIEVDLLGEITGAGSYEKMLPDTVEAVLFRRTCRVLGLKSLIFAKRAAGRPKDLEVIAELESILEETER